MTQARTSTTAAARRAAFIVSAACCVLAALDVADAGTAAPRDIGPRDLVVHTALGGFILGYDIDESGGEGLLSEALTLPGGGHDVAVETFDLATGEIIRIVAHQADSKNDFVTLGVVDNTTGLIEFEHVTQLFVDRRLYFKLDPLSGNRITGRWTPPLTTNDIIDALARDEGSPVAAFMFFRSGLGQAMLFTSDVSANTFGPLITVTDPMFASNDSPRIAYDGVMNRAVLGASNGCPLCSPRIAIVDLKNGALDGFTGRGLGYINGVAVDSARGIACTTTEIDFSVEFYDLATKTGIIRRMPQGRSQAHSGQAVQFDPLNGLFLVGQPISSTAPAGSSIQVFDEQGNFVESIDGLHLPASPVNMAIIPSLRMGYVLTAPDLTTLQSFTY
jgi:hypothetical protein